MQLSWPGSLAAVSLPRAISPGAGAVQFLATEVQRCGEAVGMPEWIVRFRPLLADPSLAPSQVTHINIAGTPAASVRQVQVRAQAEVVFSLDSLMDHRLHRSTAGEILLAMSNMAGRTGMSISSVDLGGALVPKDTVVQLHLCAADLAAVMGVRVLAS